MELEFLKLYATKLTDLEISEKLGVSRRFVNEMRNKLKLPYHTKLAKFNTEIERLCLLNYSDLKIAKLLNVSNSYVQSYRQILNLPPSVNQTSYKSKYDQTRGYMIRNVKFSAKRRGIPFNLKYTDFELPEYCPYLNIKLEFIKELGSDGNSLNHATIDRIDNSKGYIVGNIIVVSRLANQMKSCANFDQLQSFCCNMQLLINFYKNQDALGSITDIFPNTNIKNFSLDS